MRRAWRWKRFDGRARVTDAASGRGGRFTYLSVVSGVIVGALGVAGVKGFLAHGACAAVGGVGVAGWKCRWRPSSYFASIDKVFVDGPVAGFPTFVLFWTLSYNWCHLFATR